MSAVYGVDDPEEKSEMFNTMLLDCFKDTVHFETDQNFETEIFIEYKYTLNELLVKKIVFQYV